MRPTIDWTYGNLAAQGEATGEAGTSRHTDSAAPGRTTLPDIPRALDEDRFFTDGDAGRYPGGPATLVPIAFDDITPANPLRERTPEQHARRARFVRVVGAVVGGLVGLLTVGVLRAHAFHSQPSSRPAHVALPPTARSPSQALHVSDLKAPAAAPATALPARRPEPKSAAVGKGSPASEMPVVAQASTPPVARASATHRAPPVARASVTHRAPSVARARRKRRSVAVSPSDTARSRASHVGVPTASFAGALNVSH